MSSLISGVFTDSGAVAACPAPYALTLLGGSQSFSWTTICNAMSAIRPLVLFIFSIIGFRVVMEAF